MNLIFSYTGKDFAPLFPVLSFIYSRDMKRECQWRLSYWIPQPSPCLLLPIWYMEYNLLDLLFLADVFVEVLIILHIGGFSSRCTTAYLTTSLHYWQCPCTIPRTPVTAFTACSFPSCPLIWPAGVDLAKLVSSTCCLISYIWESRAHALYGKVSVEVYHLCLLACPWGPFPRRFSWLIPWTNGSLLSQNSEPWLLAWPTSFKTWELHHQCITDGDHCTPGCRLSWHQQLSHQLWWPFGAVLYLLW